MKKYETPKIEQAKFEMEDVITASTNISPDIDGGVSSFDPDWVPPVTDGNVEDSWSW